MDFPQPEGAQQEQVDVHLGHLFVAIKTQYAITQTFAGGDQLGDNQIGPGPAVAEPQRIEDAGQRLAQHHQQHRLRPIGPEGVADLDEFVGHAAHLVGGHQQQLKEDADEDQHHLGRFTDAQKNHQERNQSGNGDVTRELGDWLQGRFRNAKGPDQNSQRHGKGGGQQKTKRHPEEAESKVSPDLWSLECLAQCVDQLRPAGQKMCVKQAAAAERRVSQGRAQETGAGQDCEEPR